MKMKSLIGRLVKSLVLSSLTVPVLVSCAVDDPSGPEQFADRLVANYKVCGKVSGEDGSPVPGIMVVADRGYSYHPDTLYTDKDGLYSKFLSAPWTQSFRLSFEDIDGDANGGRFESVSEYVTPILTEMPVGSFGGSYIVSLDVTLVKK